MIKDMCVVVVIKIYIIIVVKNFDKKVCKDIIIRTQ